MSDISFLSKQVEQKTRLNADGISIKCLVTIYHGLNDNGLKVHYGFDVREMQDGFLQITFVTGCLSRVKPNVFCNVTIVALHADAYLLLII